MSSGLRCTTSNRPGFVTLAKASATRSASSGRPKNASVAAKAMAEMAKSFVKEEAPDQALPKPTGQKETISGYETEEYVSDSPKYHATYWVAKSYPNYENILQQMSLLQRGAFASITKGMPDYHALPGLPLRTEIKVPGQGQITSTIESVSLSPLAASEFDVPANYSEEKLPDILGGKQSPDKSGTP
jgi:hypothetical protein